MLALHEDDANCASEVVVFDFTLFLCFVTLCPKVVEVGVLPPDARLSAILRSIMARGMVLLMLLLALCSSTSAMTFFLTQASFVFPMSADDWQTSGTDMVFADVIITLTVVSIEDFSMYYEAQEMWNGWRRLFTNATSKSIRIDISIKAANETAANVTAGRLTADAVNLELAKAGLPNVTVLVPAFVEQRCHMAAVDLGIAASFAVLATTSVTDVGSTINGDMGVSPGTSLPAYSPYSSGAGLNGNQHLNDVTANMARLAAITALLDIHSRAECLTAYIGMVELGGRTLGPGLYTSNINMQSECSQLL